MGKTKLAVLLAASKREEIRRLIKKLNDRYECKDLILEKNNYTEKNLKFCVNLLQFCKDNFRNDNIVILFIIIDAILDNKLEDMIFHLQTLLHADSLKPDLEIILKNMRSLVGC